MAVEWGGERRSLGGALPVGDAFLMWSLAAVPAVSADTPPVPTDTASPWWRVPWHLLTLLPVAALALSAVRAWRRPGAALR